MDSRIKKIIGQDTFYFRDYEKGVLHLYYDFGTDVYLICKEVGTDELHIICLDKSPVRPETDRDYTHFYTVEPVTQTFATTYAAPCGTRFTSYIIADSFEEAERLVVKRNLGETVDGILGKYVVESLLVPRPSFLYLTNQNERLLHSLVFLSHISVNSGIRKSEEMISDSGVLHRAIHTISLDKNSLITEPNLLVDLFMLEKDLEQLGVYPKTSNSNIEYFIFDIDGVFADASSRLHYIDKDREGGVDWNAFFDEAKHDTLLDNNVMSVYETVMKYKYAVERSDSDKEVKVLAVTGRNERILDDTQEWFDNYSLIFDILYMREEGDYRPAPEMKRDIVNQLKADGGVVVMAIDDDNRILDMYKEEGIYAIHPNDIGDPYEVPRMD